MARTGGAGGSRSGVGVGLLAVLVLALLGAVAVIAVPPLVASASACTVSTADGEIGLSADEARAATTAVAREAQGATAPESRDIAPAVREQLTQGPPDDAGPSLTCRVDPAPDLQVEEITATGLTPRAEQVRHAMGEVFGEQPLGGFAPGGVDSGHGAESTHYEGRGVDVFYRPVTEENRRDGWLLAHWLVAHAETLDVQYVIFDDHYWSVRQSSRGWRDYRAPSPSSEVSRHLDHVHIDVLRGG